MLYRFFKGKSGWCLENVVRNELIIETNEYFSKSPFLYHAVFLTKRKKI